MGNQLNQTTITVHGENKKKFDAVKGVLQAERESYVTNDDTVDELVEGYAEYRRMIGSPIGSDADIIDDDVLPDVESLVDKSIDAEPETETVVQSNTEAKHTGGDTDE